MGHNPCKGRLRDKNAQWGHLKISHQKSIHNSRISKHKFPHFSQLKIYFFWSSIFKTLISKHGCTPTEDLNSLIRIPSSPPQIRATADTFYSRVLLPLNIILALLDSPFTDDFPLTDKPCVKHCLLTRSMAAMPTRNFLMCNFEIVGKTEKGKKKDMSGVNLHREAFPDSLYY